MDSGESKELIISIFRKYKWTVAVVLAGILLMVLPQGGSEKPSVRAVEEESGSEASAAELKELCGLVWEHQLPAVFTETAGSTSAAEILAAETGVCIYSLDMAMGNSSYLEAMYHNIDTLKEALG